MIKKSNMHRRYFGLKRYQSGNMLVSALMALALLAMTSLTKIKEDDRNFRANVGYSEAMTLKQIKYASDLFVDEFLLAMKQGIAFSKTNSETSVVTNIPASTKNVPIGWATAASGNTYDVTLAQLRDMGYLPPAWSIFTSSVNGGTYKLKIYSTPVGCEAANYGLTCKIQGFIWNDAPIMATEQVLGNPMIDTQVIGRILTTLGTPGGTSLSTDMSNLTGSGGSWKIPNPVAGAPAGIVAIQFEGAVSGNYLRVNDVRDPNFQSNLHVKGDTFLGRWLDAAGNPSGLDGLPSTHALDVNANSTFRGTSEHQGDVSIKDTISNKTCAIIRALTGLSSFGCDLTPEGDRPAGMAGGVRTADVIADKSVLVHAVPLTYAGYNSGAYGASAASQYATMEVNPGTGEAQIRTSGSISTDRVILKQGSNYTDAAPCVEEGSIAQGAAGANTSILVCQQAPPPVAPGTLRWTYIFETPQVESAVCSPIGRIAKGASGAALLCIEDFSTAGVSLGGHWRPFSKLTKGGVAGNDCTGQEMSVAYDMTGSSGGNAAQTALICKVNASGGSARWWRQGDLSDNQVFVMSWTVSDGSIVPMPSCMSAPTQSVSPIVIITPKIESSTDSTFKRWASISGSDYLISLKNGAGGPLTDEVGNPSVAIASTYCYYP